jgi:PqqD family protein of HPr-rel-A system
MDSALLNRLLFAQTASGKEVDISVVGVSMNPTFYENDTITVKKFDDYEIGDVLVFTYKLGELLVHRLLDKKDGLYFCKGDNSFRLEDILKDQIAGRVIRLNQRPLAPCSKQLITLSYQVNRAFVNCRYDIEKTKQTDVYQLYKTTFLRKRDTIMTYKKNEAMDYIQTDETSLAVFDPETGDTHFFDETGIDILNILNEPCDLEQLLSKLSELYDVAPEVMKADVEEFLADTTEKKVVEVL